MKKITAIVLSLLLLVAALPVAAIAREVRSNASYTVSIPTDLHGFIEPYPVVEKAKPDSFKSFTAEAGETVSFTVTAPILTWLEKGSVRVVEKGTSETAAVITPSRRTRGVYEFEMPEKDVEIYADFAFAEPAELSNATKRTLGKMVKAVMKYQDVIQAYRTSVPNDLIQEIMDDLIPDAFQAIDASALSEFPTRDEFIYRLKVFIKQSVINTFDETVPLPFQIEDYETELEIAETYTSLWLTVLRDNTVNGEMDVERFFQKVFYSIPYLTKVIITEQKNLYEAGETELLAELGDLTDDFSSGLVKGAFYFLWLGLSNAATSEYVAPFLQETEVSIPQLLFMGAYILYSILQYFDEDEPVGANEEEFLFSGMNNTNAGIVIPNELLLAAAEALGEPLDITADEISSLLLAVAYEINDISEKWYAEDTGVKALIQAGEYEKALAEIDKIVETEDTRFYKDMSSYLPEDFSISFPDESAYTVYKKLMTNLEEKYDALFGPAVAETGVTPIDFLYGNLLDDAEALAKGKKPGFNDTYKKYQNMLASVAQLLGLEGKDRADFMSGLDEWIDHPEISEQYEGILLRLQSEFAAFQPYMDEWNEREQDFWYNYVLLLVERSAAGTNKTEDTLNASRLSVLIAALLIVAAPAVTAILLDQNIASSDLFMIISFIDCVEPTDFTLFWKQMFRAEDLPYLAPALEELISSLRNLIAEGSAMQFAGMLFTHLITRSYGFDADYDLLGVFNANQGKTETVTNLFFFSLTVLVFMLGADTFNSSLYTAEPNSDHALGDPEYSDAPIVMVLATMIASIKDLFTPTEYAPETVEAADLHYARIRAELRAFRAYDGCGIHPELFDEMLEKLENAETVEEIRDATADILQYYGCAVIRNAELQNGELTMILDGMKAGTFTFRWSSVGWTIFNGSNYLAAKNGTLVYSHDPFVWTYANGSFKTVDRTGTYFLNTVEAGEELAGRPVKTSFCIEILHDRHQPKFISMPNGTHRVECAFCGKVLAASEPCHYDFRTHRCICGALEPEFLEKNVHVTTSKILIVYSTLITVDFFDLPTSSIWYSMNDGRTWIPGNLITSLVKPDNFKIRITDFNGNVYDFRCRGGKVTYEPTPAPAPKLTGKASLPKYVGLGTLFALFN